MLSSFLIAFISKLDPRLCPDEADIYCHLFSLRFDFWIFIFQLVVAGVETQHCSNQQPTMASSFGSYAQRSIKPTAAIAAGALSATIFSRSSKQTQNDEIEDNSQQTVKTVVSSPLIGFNVLRNNSYSSWHTHSPFPLNRYNATTTLCEAASSNPAEKTPYKPSDPAEPVADASNNEDKTAKPKGGMWGEEDDGLFHGLFPRRQLWRPHLEYPLWHADWDGRQPLPVESDDKDESARLTAQRDRQIRKNGVTKHIILIRHGQYDETHKVC